MVHIDKGQSTALFGKRIHHQRLRQRDDGCTGKGLEHAPQNHLPQIIGGADKRRENRDQSNTRNHHVFAAKTRRQPRCWRCPYRTGHNARGNDPRNLVKAYGQIALDLRQNRTGYGNRRTVGGIAIDTGDYNHPCRRHVDSGCVFVRVAHVGDETTLTKWLLLSFGSLVSTALVLQHTTR